MARQAEAERERRAKIINSEGELQAAENLTGAAENMSRSPAALQLRYLQTLLELGVDQNSTIVFPLPMDLVRPLLDAAGNVGANDTAGKRSEGAADAQPDHRQPDQEDRRVEDGLPR